MRRPAAAATAREYLRLRAAATWERHVLLRCTRGRLLPSMALSAPLTLDVLLQNALLSLCAPLFAIVWLIATGETLEGGDRLSRRTTERAFVTKSLSFFAAHFCAPALSHFHLAALASRVADPRAHRARTYHADALPCVRVDPVDQPERRPPARRGGDGLAALVCCAAVRSAPRDAAHFPPGGLAH